MTITHVFGLGIGKDFVADAMLKVYAEANIKAKKVRLNYETKREAAAVIREAEAEDLDVLLIVGGPPADRLEFKPWQVIQVSGGRPLFKTGRAPVSANQNIG